MPNLQEEFFKNVTNGESSEIKGINTYKRLIFNVQKHFITSSFPLYVEQTKDEYLDFLIKEYIKKSKPSIPLPIYMMKDFTSFIEINNLETRKFALEILKFELTKINIFNLPNEVRNNKFSWKKKYKLGRNAKLIQGSYSIHLDEPKTNQPTYLLIYKKLDYECHFKEITKFIYELLSIKNNNSILKNLKFISKKYNVNFTETKDIIQDTLIQYANEGILATINI